LLKRKTMTPPIAARNEPINTPNFNFIDQMR
jgi:hypothetical protein